MIPPRKPEYSELLFLAFRYCLGRQTYVVSDMVSYLKYEWPDLNDWTKNKIKEEIEFSIKHDRAGMAMDVEAWKEILEL